MGNSRTNTCDEYGSLFFVETSEMASLRPEYVHIILMFIINVRGELMNRNGLLRVLNKKIWYVPYFQG